MSLQRSLSIAALFMQMALAGCGDEVRPTSHPPEAEHEIDGPVPRLGLADGEVAVLGSSVVIPGMFTTRTRYVIIGDERELVEEGYFVADSFLEQAVDSCDPNGLARHVGVTMEFIVASNGQVSIGSTGPDPDVAGQIYRKSRGVERRQAVSLHSQDTTRALMDSLYDEAAEGSLVVSLRDFANDFDASEVELSTKGDGDHVVCVENAADGLHFFTAAVR